jgi:hypothetical protein
MKLFYWFLMICVLFIASCESAKIPYSDQDVALISEVFAETQKMHEGLLRTPAKLSLEQIQASIESLNKSTHPKIKEWKGQLTASLPKNPQDLEASFEDLSKFSLLLVEIRKEVKLPETYQQFYCPMVEKYWVSKDKEVRNPYSPEMRDCGEKIPEVQ